MRSAIVALLVGALALAMLSCKGGTTVTEVITPPVTAETVYAQLVGNYNPANGQIVTDGSSPHVLRPEFRTSTTGGAIKSGDTISIPVKNRVGVATVTWRTDAPMSTDKGMTFGWQQLDTQRVAGKPVVVYDVSVGTLTIVSYQRDADGTAVSASLAWEPGVPFGNKLGAKASVSAPAVAMGELAAMLNGLTLTAGFVERTITIHEREDDWLVAAVAGIVGLIVAVPPVCPLESVPFQVEFIDKGGNSDGGVIPPPPPANQPPVAVITATPSSGTAPLGVTLNASGSYDSDGHIVRYEWDINGDGVWDADTGITPSAFYSYPAVGTVTPKVRVTDDDGAQDTASTSVTVNEPQPPPVVTYTLFVAGTKGPLMESAVWSVDETGSQVVNIFELRGSDGSRIIIPTADVVFSPSVLPAWCWIGTTGEVMTVLWAEPQDPDIEDPGNIFINPGDYSIKFVVSHSGKSYTRNWTLTVLDRPDFP